MDFKSDRPNRCINNILKKYDFLIQLVNKLGKTVKTALKEKRDRVKHQNCIICNILPDNFMCNDRFVVYKFTCRICNECYIGETCRPFNCRFSEHKRSLNKNDDKSALSNHFKVVHERLSANISDFDLQIVKKCSNPVETRLAEARAISTYRPALNRRHEKTPL